MAQETRAKGGDRFAAETELAPLVEAWLESIGSSCVGHEVQLGFGVPDLVGGVGSSASLRNRRRQSSPIIKPLELAVLQFCKRPRSEAELREWYESSFSELVRRALTPLMDREMLALRDAKYRARVAPKDPFERLVAVELKLADATRGLAQAHSYRAFAESSYLAMPAYRISVDLMERARSIGVGVLAVHRGFVEEVVEPDQSSHATAKRRRMATEHTLAAAATGRDRVAGMPRGARRAPRSTR